MPARLTDPEQLRELLGVPFTEEQLACITAPCAPQAIVAGAGSGKTTVMAARVVWLTGTGQVAPERVLGLTFTNKAAGELAERVRKALTAARIIPPPGEAGQAQGGPAGEAGEVGEAGEPTVSTYHAFAGRLLRDHGLRLGIEPAARLLADAGRFQLAAEVLRAAPAEFEPQGGTFTSLVADLIALDAEMSEHLVTPERLREFDAALLGELERAELTNADLRLVPQAARGRGQLLTLVEAYRARKRAGDLLDFGDQIALAATLARDVPEVGAALRGEFGVVLLDEYQDTSVAQRVMLAGLFGGGTGHPVTAVGDPCQAIYGWRGASVANLDDFPAHFPHRDGTEARRDTLGENRRSGGRLLALANDLAAPLRERHPSVVPLRPAPGADGVGLVRCALLRTHAEELDWLADSVAHLVRTGTPPGEIAVLCRTAADFADIQRALVARQVPVEVVGLAGLLHLPEVADLVAVCEVLADPTANAPLVRLLTGPRWRIGPRDLALLGRLARRLVRRGDQPEGAGEAEALAAAVAGTDPAEVTSLADALDTFVAGGERGREGPPEHEGLPFDPAARVRFAHLAAEIRELRRSLGDPLMDVLHRVLAVTGLEVELSASPQALAARRRETLGAFLDLAAGFASGRTGAAVDGSATLPAFLAFLRAAVQYDKGLDGSLPGGEDTVKVLTAHKAKGLEWDVVAVPGLCREVFPATSSRDSWLRQARALPHPLRGDAATLPEVAEWTARAHKEYQAELGAHLALEELRLGYVTFTRPRTLLLGSGHWWGPSQKRPRGPSGFLDALRAHCTASPANGEVEAWADPPAEGEENPALTAAEQDLAWPLPLDAAALARRRAAAEAVIDRLRGIPRPRGGRAAGAAGEPGADEYGAEAGEEAVGEEGVGEEGAGEGGVGEEGAGGGEAAEGEAALTPEERRTVASWDRDLAALAAELRQARAAVREVPLPASLSASQVQRLAADPEGFARELARPMPRPPQPAARRGTRFHAWVESRFEELALPMLGPDEPPGGEFAESLGTYGEYEDAAIRDERDLEALKEAFANTPYATRRPYRVEAPFQLHLAGRVIRGRIDAVYRTPNGGFEIIDWKTNRRQDADPLQLAIYRLAWAERHELPLSSVSAAFLYVRSGELVRPSVLPGRRGLERLLLGEDSWEPNDPGQA
ncbi:ATP-dependent helicase [Streptomyces hoynatensis]|uniref:DNA 3'-5' helicase n=1 Tax=Streptomyces hoynatensis TaxID=1141874 RepID=A0A3A9ZIR1_9ACTN|nr:ATP-dependent DNA helicase [Streptomyces hoynatensis]RKN47106.1 ATP-dependent helicase [Streptomyces hoynatensis]